MAGGNLLFLSHGCLGAVVRRALSAETAFGTGDPSTVELDPSRASHVPGCCKHESSNHLVGTSRCRYRTDGVTKPCRAPMYARA
jgi:hypothetical protein